MGEVEIVTQCWKCETEFDDEYDTVQCIFCNENFCDSCQSEHANEILFDDSDKEIEEFLEIEKQNILKTERDRVRKKKK